MFNQNQKQDRIDEVKLQEFAEKVIGDLASTLSSVMVNVGDRLGLYEALANAKKPLDSNELSRITGNSERCIREWLANQAAGGYIIYDKETQRYSFPQEHAMVLANINSPIYLLGGFQAASSYFKDMEKTSPGRGYRGRGFGWRLETHRQIYPYKRGQFT